MFENAGGHQDESETTVRGGQGGRRGDHPLLPWDFLEQGDPALSAHMDGSLLEPFVIAGEDDSKVLVGVLAAEVNSFSGKEGSIQGGSGFGIDGRMGAFVQGEGREAKVFSYNFGFGGGSGQPAEQILIRPPRRSFFERFLGQETPLRLQGMELGRKVTFFSLFPLRGADAYPLPLGFFAFFFLQIPDTVSGGGKESVDDVALEVAEGEPRAANRDL
jgi:hypothetical protein